MSLKPNWGEGRLVAPSQFSSVHYLSVFEQLFDRYGPLNYLEIGVCRGQSMQHARGHAVGVDPHFQIDFPVYKGKSALKLFQKTSDDFFQEVDVQQEFNGEPIDLAFIDGLHTAEQTLIDFQNVESYLHRDSVVMLHDCIPQTIESAEPTRTTLYWTGDVWRTAVCLQEHRPDLQVAALDCRPSGLLMVTGFDPGRLDSPCLLDHLAEITDISSYVDGLQVYSTDEFLDDMPAQLKDVGATLGRLEDRLILAN